MDFLLSVQHHITINLLYLFNITLTNIRYIYDRLFRLPQRCGRHVRNA